MLTGSRVLNMLPNQGEWFRIDNKADVADVWIYDDIGFLGTTAADFFRLVFFALAICDCAPVVWVSGVFATCCVATRR